MALSVLEKLFFPRTALKSTPSVIKRENISTGKLIPGVRDIRACSFIVLGRRQLFLRSCDTYLGCGDDCMTM